MFLATLENLNRIQEARLSAIQLAGELKRLSWKQGPPTRQCGLYWVYTSHSEEELRAALPAPNRGAVPVAVLAQHRNSLANICKREVDGFRLVYNGIGGLGKKGTGGLRERVLQECKGGEGTGTLGICNTSLSDLSRWRFSYVLWRELNHLEPLSYPEDARNIETMWRLHYGWPILCAR